MVSRSPLLQIEHARESERGTALVHIMVTLVLSGIVTMTMSSLGKILGKQQLQSSSTFQLSLVSQQFATVLRNGSSWAKTVSDAANISLKCLRDHSPCPTTGGTLRISKADGTLLMGYDPLTSKKAGFTSNGAVCDSHSSVAGSGNDSCPYRLEISWKPVCSNSSCIDPQVEIKGVWSYRPKSAQRTIAFNTQNYNFSIIQGSSASGGGLSCRVVYAICNEPWADGEGCAARAKCDDNETLTGGGGFCETPNKNCGLSRCEKLGFIHYSQMDGNSWVVDCYTADGTGDPLPLASAMCCRVQ